MKKIVMVTIGYYSVESDISHEYYDEAGPNFRNSRSMVSVGLI